MNEDKFIWHWDDLEWEEPFQFANPYTRQKGGKFGFKTGGMAPTRAPAPGEAKLDFTLERTANDIANQLKGKYPSHDFSGINMMNDTAARQIGKELDALAQDYPRIFGNLKRIELESPNYGKQSLQGSTYAAVRGELDSGEIVMYNNPQAKCVMVFNSQWFGKDAMPSRVEDAYRQDRANGWHPQTANPFTSVAYAAITAHEFGHVAHAWVRKEYNGEGNYSADEAAWRSAGSAASRVSVYASTSMAKERGRAEDTEKSYLDKNIPGWEAVEPWAEAFSAIRHGTPEAKANSYVRAVDKAIRDTNSEIDDYYKNPTTSEVEPSHWSELLQFLPTWAELLRFYNPAHDARGRFAHGSLGSKKTMTNTKELQTARDWLKEKGWSQKSMVDNMQATFEKAKTTGAYEEGLGWYQNANNLASELSASTGGKIPMEQAAGVIAAMSPQLGWDTGTDLKVDNREAARLVIDMVSGKYGKSVTVTEADVARRVAIGMNYKNADVAAGRNGMTPEKAKAWEASETARLKAMVGTHSYASGNAEAIATFHPGKNGALSANMVKAIKIARGGDPNVILSGDKVRSFWDNIVYPKTSRSVTIDAHQIRAMTRFDLTDAKAAVAVRGPARYELFSAAVRSGARKAGIAPMDYQAVVWTQWRRDHDVASRRKVLK